MTWIFAALEVPAVVGGAKRPQCGPVRLRYGQEKIVHFSVTNLLEEFLSG